MFLFFTFTLPFHQVKIKFLCAKKKVFILQNFVLFVFCFGPALLWKQNQATDDYGTVGGGESYLDCKEIICNYKDPRIAHHSPPQNIAQLSVDRLLF